VAIQVNGGFRNKRGQMPALSDINVIPLVDVVLVLLIIFMLTASVMEFGIRVEVPRTKTAATSAQNLPVLELSRQGDLYLNGKQINVNLLKQEVGKRFPGAQAVYLRADGELTWNTMAQVVAEAKTAGLALNLVTKPIEKK
jgi:biopolymer transport protein ExbD